MSRTAKRGVALCVAALVWACYLLQEELAFYGLYTLFGYNVHELAGLIPVFCLLATVVALVALVMQMVRRTGEWSDKWFVLFLAVLCLAQGLYVYRSSQVMSVSTVAKVADIDRENGTITVVGADGEEEPVVLAAPDLVTNLLRVGNERYSVVYERQPGQREQGRLMSIALCDP